MSKPGSSEAADVFSTTLFSPNPNNENKYESDQMMLQPDMRFKVSDIIIQSNTLCIVS